MSLYDDVLKDMGTSPSASPTPVLAPNIGRSTSSLSDQLASDLAAPTAPPAADSWWSRALDVQNALGTGGVRGLIRNTIGMPGDLAANVVDLAKATVGAPYIAATGRAPPDWLQLTPRDQRIGTTETLLNGIRKLGGSALVDPQNPTYEGGYAQTIGGALSGATNPSQAANAIAGATASKAVSDATGSPAWGALAGLTPNLARPGVAAAAKYGVRGGEQGRQDMVNRIGLLSDAGVQNPTLGLASGNQLIGGVENLLQATPGAVGTMRRARDTAVGGLQNTVQNAAALAAPVRGPSEAGQAIQTGIQNFGQGARTTQGNLETNLYNSIPSSMPITPTNTATRLATLNPNPGAAPGLLGPLTPSLFGRLDTGLNADLSNPNTSTPGTIPFSALRQARTAIGPRTQSGGVQITGDPTTGDYKYLYGGMSQDLRDAAAQAGPGAVNALNRVNAYTSALKDRQALLQPFANRPAPEQAYTAYTGAAPSTMQAVKKSIDPLARGTVASSVLDTLGLAKAGNQNAAGTVFSPESYLTNYGNLGADRRGILFSGFPNAPAVSQAAQNVAGATSLMRDNSRMWANPSGTGANTAARATLGALIGSGGAGAAGLLNPLIPLGIGASMGAARGLAGLVTSPSVVRAAARPTYINPDDLGAQLRTLYGLTSPRN